MFCSEAPSFLKLDELSILTFEYFDALQIAPWHIKSTAKKTITLWSDFTWSQYALIATYARTKRGMDWGALLRRFEQIFVPRLGLNPHDHFLEKVFHSKVVPQPEFSNIQLGELRCLALEQEKIYSKTHFVWLRIVTLALENQLPGCPYTFLEYSIHCVYDIKLMPLMTIYEVFRRIVTSGKVKFYAILAHFSYLRRRCQPKDLYKLACQIHGKHSAIAQGVLLNQRS